MKKLFKTLSILMLCAAFFSACNNDETAAVEVAEIVSPAVLAQIKALGFSTDNVVKQDGGYLLEGDIFMSEKELGTAYFEEIVLRIADVEQYRTTNLVSVPGSTRTLRIAMTTNLPSSYSTALNTAISRYNAENLRLRFTRVSAYPVDILFDKAPDGSGYLASAGFPSGGNPFGTVLVNSTSIGSSPNSNYLASILAHEMGHCIGFRHTDYMGRQYSCGGSPVNEGSGGVGAILIPGTPSGPDPNSWMLACIGTGVNRPFNANDRTALNFVY
jgi:hypothetical protein